MISWSSVSGAYGVAVDLEVVEPALPVERVRDVHRLVFVVFFHLLRSLLRSFFAAVFRQTDSRRDEGLYVRLGVYFELQDLVLVVEQLAVHDESDQVAV